MKSNNKQLGGNLKFFSLQTFHVDKNSKLKIGLIMFIESARALIDLVEICKTAVKISEQGKVLFEEMLHREGNVHPAKIAYDRPSSKLIGFLAKHYGLRNYVP